MNDAMRTPDQPERPPAADPFAPDADAHFHPVPAIAPGSRPELAALEARILAERGRISPLYQVLLNSPAIATGWERMLTAVRNQSTVPADLRELLILRVAVLNRAAFEFDAHAPIALKAGVSPEKIAALRRPTIGEPFSDRERTLLALADAMTRDVQVPDALLQQVAEGRGAQQVLELVATVAAYNMVSRLLVALRVGH